jgi:hypothetical protein
MTAKFDPWPFLIGGLGGYFLIAFYEEFLLRGGKGNRVVIDTASGLGRLAAYVSASAPSPSRRFLSHEPVVTDLPDYVVEAVEGFDDALRGEVGGYVDGGLQYEADVEDAGDRHVQELLGAGRAICGPCCLLAAPGSSGGGCVQVRVDRDQPIKAVEGKHTADGISGDREPQLGAVSNSAVVSTCQSVRAGVITRECPGQVRDQHSRAAVHYPQQLLSHLAGVGDVDVLRKRDHRLLARPPYRTPKIASGRNAEARDAAYIRVVRG